MKGFNSDNNKNVSSTTEHSIDRVAFCNKRVCSTPVGYNVQIHLYVPILYEFHYLPSYNWKMEDVTTKSFNSNKYKNVSCIVEHRSIGWHSVTNGFGVP